MAFKAKDLSVTENLQQQILVPIHQSQSALKIVGKNPSLRQETDFSTKRSLNIPECNSITEHDVMSAAALCRYMHFFVKQRQSANPQVLDLFFELENVWHCCFIT